MLATKQPNNQQRLESILTISQNLCIYMPQHKAKTVCTKKFVSRCWSNLSDYNWFKFAWTCLLFFSLAY